MSEPNKVTAQFSWRERQIFIAGILKGMRDTEIPASSAACERMMREEGLGPVTMESGRG